MDHGSGKRKAHASNQLLIRIIEWPGLHSSTWDLLSIVLAEKESGESGEKDDVSGTGPQCCGYGRLFRKMWPWRWLRVAIPFNDLVHDDATYHQISTTPSIHT